MINIRKSIKKHWLQFTLIILICVLAAVIWVIMQDSPSEPTITTNNTIQGIQELLLNEQDLQLLGMTTELNEQDLQQLGITGNGTNCKIEEDYTNIVDSSLGQYSICIYNISSLNDTEVIIELKKFTNFEALNGTYQYDSLHLYSIEGLISENDYGDQSRFRVNNVNDYGGQFNDPNVFYYHLWFSKDEYLIHITSKGGSKEAADYIAKIGRRILTKFG
ncbi:MAG: hypothetical protein AABX51_08795 [Nanoarchaeota archaeon]